MEEVMALPLAIYFFLYYGALIHDNYVEFCNVMHTFETDYILCPAANYAHAPMCMV